VAMVTGLEDTDSIQRAYLAGATDFLTKPLNLLLFGLQFLLCLLQEHLRFLTLHQRLLCFFLFGNIAPHSNYGFYFSRFTQHAVCFPGEPAQTSIRINTLFVIS